MDILEEVILSRVEEIVPLPDIGFREMLLQYSFKCLGWTNLDLAELMANLEEEFEVTIVTDKFIDVYDDETIEDVVNYISLLKGF